MQKLRSTIQACVQLDCRNISELLSRVSRRIGRVLMGPPEIWKRYLGWEKIGTARNERRRREITEPRPSGLGRIQDVTSPVGAAHREKTWALKSALKNSKDFKIRTMKRSDTS